MLFHIFSLLPFDVSGSRGNVEKSRCSERDLHFFSARRGGFSTLGIDFSWFDWESYKLKSLKDFKTSASYFLLVWLKTWVQLFSFVTSFPKNYFIVLIYDIADLQFSFKFLIQKLSSRLYFSSSSAISLHPHFNPSITHCFSVLLFSEYFPNDFLLMHLIEYISDAPNTVHM